MHFLGKTLLAFALPCSVLQDQICLLAQVFLDFLLFLESPIMKRTSFLGVVLKGLEGLHRTVQLPLLQHYWLGHRLGLLCDIEWFALEMNRDHSVVFEIVSKYCISDSFVDHDGYSILLRDSCPQ